MQQYRLSFCLLYSKSTTFLYKLAAKLYKNTDTAKPPISKNTFWHTKKVRKRLQAHFISIHSTRTNLEPKSNQYRIKSMPLVCD